MPETVDLVDQPLDRQPIPRDTDFFHVYKLKTQGFSERQIAKVLDKSKTTIHNALQHFTSFLPDSAQLHAYEQARPQLLSAVEQQLMASLMDPDKLSKASLNNVAYAFQQAFNARRLETGQSTSNLSVLSKLIEDSDTKLHASRAEKRTTGFDSPEKTTDK